MAEALALELKGITKTFGSVVANKNVDLKVKKGEILSILGENGSGKTTLMNMVSGIYYPDSGEILVDGKNVVISSPKDAFAYKIGMTGVLIGTVISQMFFWIFRSKNCTAIFVRSNRYFKCINSAGDINDFFFIKTHNWSNNRHVSHIINCVHRFKRL